MVSLVSNPGFANPNASLAGGLSQLGAAYEAGDPRLVAQLKLHVTNEAGDPLVLVHLAPGADAVSVLQNLATVGFRFKVRSQSIHRWSQDFYRCQPRAWQRMLSASDRCTRRSVPESTRAPYRVKLSRCKRRISRSNAGWMARGFGLARCRTVSTPVPYALPLPQTMSPVAICLLAESRCLRIRRAALTRVAPCCSSFRYRTWLPARFRLGLLRSGGLL